MKKVGEGGELSSQLCCPFLPQAAGLHPTAEQIEMFAYHLPETTLSNLIVSGSSFHFFLGRAMSVLAHCVDRSLPLCICHL